MQPYLVEEHALDNTEASIEDMVFLVACPWFNFKSTRCLLSNVFFSSSFFWGGGGGGGGCIQEGSGSCMSLQNSTCAYLCVGTPEWEKPYEQAVGQNFTRNH